MHAKTGYIAPLILDGVVPNWAKYLTDALEYDHAVYCAMESASSRSLRACIDYVRILPEFKEIVSVDLFCETQLAIRRTERHDLSPSTRD